MASEGGGGSGGVATVGTVGTSTTVGASGTGKACRRWVGGGRAGSRVYVSGKCIIVHPKHMGGKSEFRQVAANDNGKRPLWKHGPMDCRKAVEGSGAKKSTKLLSRFHMAQWLSWPF